MDNREEELNQGGGDNRVATSSNVEEEEAQPALSKEVKQESKPIESLEDANEPGEEITGTNEVPDETPQTSQQDLIIKKELQQKLRPMISNLYLNVRSRLHIPYPHLCILDVQNCNRHHYRTANAVTATVVPSVKEPSHTKLQILFEAFEKQDYASISECGLSMCHRREFPGEDVLTKLLSLLLAEAKPDLQDVRQRNYIIIYELANLIIKVFPPCQTALRAAYENFIERPVKAPAVLGGQEPHGEGESIIKSLSLIGSLLDLLEHYLSKDTQAEHLTNSLEHLFLVYGLVVKVLAHDLSTWLLHNQKRTQRAFFRSESSPLVVLMFGLTYENSALTAMTERLFHAFAQVASKEWCIEYLQILERLICLIMVSLNTSELLLCSDTGVNYPSLGERTRQLIVDFFKIYKLYNVSKLSVYGSTFQIMHCPFMRCELIHQFLQLFYFSKGEAELTPRKVAFDLSKQKWLKYKTQEQLLNEPESDAEEELSRETYLDLLLHALKAYNEWYAVDEYVIISRARPQNLFEVLTKPATTPTESVHHNPTKGAGRLMLEKIEADIDDLEQKIRLTARVARPTVDLPLAPVAVEGDLIDRYYSDMKFLRALNEIVNRQAKEHPEEDFGDWIQYLRKFVD